MTLQTDQRVAIVIDRSGSYFGGALLGIGRYVSAKGGWILHGFPPFVCPEVGPLADWDGPGAIIGRAPADELHALAERGVAVVDVTGHEPIEGIPRIDVDNLAIGALAAEFFLDRGYRSFAFYDTSQRHGQLRLEGYERRLAREGCRPIVVSSEGEGVRDRLAEAVQRLDPPVALLCTNDVMGYSACRALSERGVMIPHHTAVLGVDDDHLLCRFASPPLSSIALPNDRVGYLAAETLDRLLAGETVPAERLLPPLHVVERESTALLAVEDAAVAAAMQFIAENADEPLQVEDVAREAGLSARTLQRRFRKALGRTVWAEIHRAHVSRAQKLLTGTRMSIAEIAVASGFADFRRMAEAFRKSVGVSPAAYRRQHVDGQA